MRLTVGPLPPAVYWRRRAVVLGAGLLFLIVLLYSCTGSDRKPGTTGDAQPTPGATTSGAAPETSGTPLSPQTGTPAPEGSAGAAPSDGPAPTDAAPPPVVPAVDDGTCTDTEITVTAAALSSSVVRGATVELQLKIRNRSERTCSRDVGAEVQELFIKSGAETIWSSDTCGTGKGSDVQSFTPGFERSYQLGWNGRDSTRCADGVAAGPNPPAGTYQVFARVGTKLSEPARLTVTG
ncbi:hypothetical protein [Micromonospora endolithica]|uniref:Uncharacterized protein n=1 Tax=Micromonospora endolithica TaxID=230091 RepID=A0A3A9YS79_9ACTN|nr:hypothetical protein [Micromonospora endolithica]RKN38843.1 hypothetical protein D7223_29850 [Micromonospora endolithica]TWJ25467.1 hypothetical protein JD76_05638 [Micromonospora endolithica]